MLQYGLCFALFLLSTVRANQNDCQLDGSRGLKRGVHVQGNRASYGNFVVDKFHRLQVSVGSSSVVSNYRECALSCVNTPPCSSFNVASSPRSDGKYRCELLNEDKYSANPDKLVISQDYHHYSIKTPCSSLPCQNGAKCVPNYSEDKYRCDCLPGYTGRHCETDINECSSNPCLNGGTCVDEVNGYLCNCQTGFTGVYCAVFRPTSCGRLSGSSSGNYIIDPDGNGGVAPFSVYCDMSDKNGVGVTVISHDSESRTHVGPNECYPAGCYSKDVQYTGVSTAQLAALTRVSQNCEQFIKFECHNDVTFIEGSYAWWVSRNGTQMNYWGGAKGHDKMCACGVTNTCTGGTKCNCDNHGTGWYEDSGLLTNKSALPVTQIRLGDLDQSHEEGYHTLGKLKCHGQA